LSTIVSSRHAARQPFQEFLDEHRQAVLAFLRAMVGPDDAEDCFQETFIAAMRAYEDMDGRYPRAWVMTIARRKAIDHHRARARRPLPSEDLPEAAAPAASGGLGDLNGEVWSAVAGLSDSQRAAVALRYAGDLAYREIAAALEISEEAARRRVADGLRALRENVDREEAVR
jgi:RNA polymerase sigma factor (sigma-70 family)